MTAVTEYAVFARFPRTVHDDALTNRIEDPAVRAFVDAPNAGDRTAFRAALTPDATTSDDGTDRDLARWTEKEIFSSRGHLIRTRWVFTVRDGKVARFETGQA